MRISIRIAVGAGRDHRPDQDLKVEPERPVVDVVQIELDPALHLVVAVGLATEAVDLRPSCYPRLDVMPTRIERDSLLVLAIVRERMRTRPDQRHVALEHVEELGNLIDVPAPQPGSDLGDARIVPPRLAWVMKASSSSVRIVRNLMIRNGF